MAWLLSFEPMRCEDRIGIKGIGFMLSANGFKRIHDFLFSYDAENEDALVKIYHVMEKLKETGTVGKMFVISAKTCHNMTQFVVKK